MSLTFLTVFCKSQILHQYINRAARNSWTPQVTGAYPAYTCPNTLYTSRKHVQNNRTEQLWQELYKQVIRPWRCFLVHKRKIKFKTVYNLPAVVVAAVSSPDYSTCGELLLSPRRALWYLVGTVRSNMCYAFTLCLWMWVMVHECAVLGDVSCVVSSSLWGVVSQVGGASGLTAGPWGNIDVPDISQAWSHDLHEVGWGL